MPPRYEFGLRAAWHHLADGVCGTGCPRNQSGKKPFGAVPSDVILVLFVSRVSHPFQTHPLT